MLAEECDTRLWLPYELAGNNKIGVEEIPFRYGKGNVAGIHAVYEDLEGHRAFH